MPYSRTRPNPLQAMVGGFVGGVGQGIGMYPQIKQRQLEQEKKGQEDLLKKKKEEARILSELYGKEDPRYLQTQVDQYKIITGVDLGRGGPQRMERLPFPAPGGGGFRSPTAIAGSGDVARQEMSTLATAGRERIAAAEKQRAAATTSAHSEALRRWRNLWAEKSAHEDKMAQWTEFVGTSTGIVARIMKVNWTGTDKSQRMEKAKEAVVRLGHYDPETYELRLIDEAVQAGGTPVLGSGQSTPGAVPLQGPTVTGDTLDVAQGIGGQFVNEGDVVVDNSTGKRYRITNGQLVPIQ